jgi:hypothetical protein
MAFRRPNPIPESLSASLPTGFVTKAEIFKGRARSRCEREQAGLQARHGLAVFLQKRAQPRGGQPADDQGPREAGDRKVGFIAVPDVELLNEIQVDQERTIDANERRTGEETFPFADPSQDEHGVLLAQQDPRVGGLGLDRGDFVDGDHAQESAVPKGNQIVHLQRSRGSIPGRRNGPQAPDSLGKTLRMHRLQEIVEGVGLKGPDGEGVVRGDKDNWYLADFFPTIPSSITRTMEPF